jgi:hypothetical protein
MWRVFPQFPDCTADDTHLARHALPHYRVTVIECDPNFRISVEPERLRMALGLKPAHTRSMTSRRSSYVTGRRDDALVCRADALGSTAVLASFPFGTQHVHQPC